MRRLARTAVLCICAMALGAGVASASSSIPNTALPLSATGADVADPQVAVAPDGSAYYAWVRFNGTVNVIQAARVSSAGTVGTIQTLSNPAKNASLPDVAASPLDGTAIVAWQEFPSSGSDRLIKHARLLTDGSVGTTQTASSPTDDSIEADVSIDSAGTAIIVWIELTGDDAILLRQRSSADVQNAIANVAPASPSDPGTDFSEPHVAADPVGASPASVIAYRAVDSASGNQRILYKRRASSGVFNSGIEGIPVSLTGASVARDQSQVATDPSGASVVTWREDVGTTNQIKARRIESSENAPTATIKDLSDPAQSAQEPQVDMAGDGDAELVWLWNNGTTDVAQARTLTPASGLTATPHDLRTNADEPQVAVDSAGNVTYAWRSGGDIESRAKLASCVPVNETLTSIEDLTSAGSNTEPRVDANASGARWGAYRRDNGTNDQAFGFFDLTAPGSVETCPSSPSSPSAPPSAAAVTPTPAGPTGLRAAALKKCKKKHGAARAKCKKKANLLPI
jgi:hypothetical protein